MLELRIHGLQARFLDWEGGDVMDIFMRVFVVIAPSVFVVIAPFLCMFFLAIILMCVAALIITFITDVVLKARGK